jgi:hypothetical protein
MPQKAHNRTIGDSAGIRPNPRLVRTEGDTNLTCPVVRLVTGRLAIIKPSPVACNERAAVAHPLADRLKMVWP